MLNGKCPIIKILASINNQTPAIIKIYALVYNLFLIKNEKL